MKTLKCLTFSDLHILARSARYEEIKVRLFEEIAKADVIQMNGDIIELFYPKHLLEQVEAEDAYLAAAQEGAKWLEELLQKHPKKQFMYLEGNHENCDRFRDHIYALRKQHPNLTWGRTYMTIGDGHFFHGDNETENKDVEKRERGQLKDIYSGALCEKANLTGELPVMRFMRWFSPDNKIIDKIYNFIQKVHPQRLEGVKHMFFGHTHLPFLAKLRHGLMWYNTGSASHHGADNF